MIKKSLSLFILMFFFSSIANAQIKDKLSFELDLIRFSNSLGIYKPYGSQKWSYLNSLEIGFKLGQKINYFAKVRRVNVDFSSMLGRHADEEKTQNKGFELNTGIEFVPNRERVFHMSYGLELFAEFTKHKGDHIGGSNSPSFEINVKKRYLGIAPRIKAHYRITENISVSASCRFRVGHSSVEDLNSNNFSFDDTLGYFEPLSSLALRLEL